tara:strand:- start:249 stop:401 length:153 start_codon:yes stop_codon:yes gene_type:complete
VFGDLPALSDVASQVINYRGLALHGAFIFKTRALFGLPILRYLLWRLDGY